MSSVEEQIKVESMEWALKQFADALLFASNDRRVSMDEVWERYFEPPVFSLDLSPETKAIVMTALFRFA